MSKHGKSDSKDEVDYNAIDSKCTHKSQWKKSSSYATMTLLAMGLTTSLCAQLICDLAISQYNALHARNSPGRIARLLCIRNVALRPEDFKAKLARSCVSDLPVPNFVNDPSASTFVNVVMIYGLAVLIFYNIRKDDRYEDHFLTFGALCGILAGTVTSWYEWDLQALKDYIPISITAALTLSLVSHIVLAWFNSPRKVA
jgi:hypothetical protein